MSNKSDLPSAWTRPDAVPVSAATGSGIAGLKQRMLDLLEMSEGAECPAITNARHVALVERADAALGRARQAVGPAGGALSEEFVLVDLQEARQALEEITGRRAPEDVLAQIFSRFCIGK